MVIKRSWLASAVLGVVGIAGGCALHDKGKKPEATSAITQAISSTNGLAQNGLSANGMFSNGLMTNGFWANGFWANGFWANGFWANGFWANGFWANGFWANGFWANGFWANGFWANGLPLDGGFLLMDGGIQPAEAGPPQFSAPGIALRSSVYARKLLTYIYGCAMPPSTQLCGDGGGTNNPDGGAAISYDTTLDPNAGTLTCGDNNPCDDGYICQFGHCVVPLNGLIGVAINADGTAWWESGTCDESCERWVSACVLARTNAYGQHVEISMRAPNPPNVPQERQAQFSRIQAALQTCPGETDAFPLREGTYYGNIFQTSPGMILADGGVGPAPPGPDGSSASPILFSPIYTACSGPGSDLDEVTRRACSSVGNQVVIKVPGVCEPTGNPALQAMCDGIDDASTGAAFGCRTDTDGGTHFDEVITVYLAHPTASCGNSICEFGELDPCSPNYCPGDCHVQTWARDLAPNVGRSILGEDFPQGVNPTFGLPGPGGPGMSAITQNGGAVVSGTAAGDVNLSGADGGTLSADAGVGVVANYDVDGGYVWGARLGSASVAAAEGGVATSQLQRVDGVTVAPTGNITVVGTAVESTPGNADQAAIWISTYAPDGGSLGTWNLPIGDTSLGTQQPNRGLAVDSQGNVVLSRAFVGTVTLGANTFTATGTPGSGSIVIGAFLAKIALPDPGSPPAVVWAQDVSITSGINYPVSVAIDSADNILVIPANLNCGEGCSDGTNMSKLAPDGGRMWSVPTNQSTGFFSTAAFDTNGNVYASGLTTNGQLFDISSSVVTGTKGLPPFIAKFDSAGNFLWLNYANIQCPSYLPDCVPSVIQGTGIGFDPNGNVVLTSYGNPGVGGSVDFTGVISPPSTRDAGIPPFSTFSTPYVFLSSYEPDAGAAVWAEGIAMNDQSSLLGTTVDSRGHVAVSGNYTESMQVDDQFLHTASSDDPTIIDSYVAEFRVPTLAASFYGAPQIGIGKDETGAQFNSVPGPIWAEATGPGGAVVFYATPTALDGTPRLDLACGATPDGGATPLGARVECNPPPNSMFPFTTRPITTTPVQCVATDPFGNQTSLTFPVTVADTFGPVFSLVSDVNQPAAGATGANVTYPIPTATDQVDGVQPVICTPASGSLFAIGPTPVTCTASDLSNNQSQTTFMVNVAAPNGTPPSCALAHVVAGPPKQLIITVQDSNAGVQSIQVTESVNATVAVPPFSAGDMSQLIVVATKVDQTQGAKVALHITGVDGLTTDCDPVVPGEAVLSSAPAPANHGSCNVGPGGGAGRVSELMGAAVGLALLRRRRRAPAAT